MSDLPLGVCYLNLMNELYQKIKWENMDYSYKVKLNKSTFISFSNVNFGNTKELKRIRFHMNFKLHKTLTNVYINWDILINVNGTPEFLNVELENIRYDIFNKRKIKFDKIGHDIPDVGDCKLIYKCISLIYLYLNKPINA
jgi:hypothetical protein